MDATLNLNCHERLSQATSAGPVSEIRSGQSGNHRADFEARQRQLRQAASACEIGRAAEHDPVQTALGGRNRQRGHEPRPASNLRPATYDRADSIFGSRHRGILAADKRDRRGESVVFTESQRISA